MYPPVMKIVIVVLLLALSGAAYAQFNRCGYGFCPGGEFVPGFVQPTIAVVPPVCVPGASTGEMDFSVCSNIAITAAVF